MILFVNVFITDQRIHSKAYGELAVIRKAYFKLDIFKYTLASYSVIEWKEAIFYIKLDTNYEHEWENLQKYIREIFSCEIKIYPYRIDSYDQWIENIGLTQYDEEEWIWFTCNDDHPFIDSSLEMLNKIISEASRLSKDEQKYVAIFLSHWQETMAQVKRGLKLRDKPCKGHSQPQFQIIENTPEYYLTNASSCISIQIITKKLLQLWFSDKKNRCHGLLSRTDDIGESPDNQLTLIPYKELVRHFDVYSHSSVPHEIVPPMFIPGGFFEHKIKIQYGGDHRIPGYTFLHPMKKMISQELHHKKRTFSDQCDSNILLDELPLFWKNRICEKQVYPIPRDLEKKAYLHQKIREVCSDPRFGYTPVESIYKLTPVFYQKFNPDLKELKKIAISAWSFKENFIFRWKKFKISYLEILRYNFSTWMRLRWPVIWNYGKNLISKPQ